MVVAGPLWSLIIASHNSFFSNLSNYYYIIYHLAIYQIIIILYIISPFIKQTRKDYNILIINFVCSHCVMVNLGSGAVLVGWIFLGVCCGGGETRIDLWL